MNGERFFLAVSMSIDKCGGTIGVRKSPFTTIVVKTG